MADPRYQKLAGVLIHYALGIRPGDRLLIVSAPPAAPLIREVYREALRAGAHPETRIELAGLDEIRLREGSDEQVRYLSEPRLREADSYDAQLRIGAAENTMALSGVDPRRIAMAQQAQSPLRGRLSERTARRELRRTGTLFPTPAYAQQAGMSLPDYEEFVFHACLIDRDDPAATWRAHAADWQRIADFLAARDEIRIVAPGTDVTYRVGGRTWINSSGSNETGSLNFPSGEVYTGPIEGSVNGTVRFTYPAIYLGNEVADVRLTFRDGKVVAATAARGQALLDSMLDLDEGARYLGEVAFGLNEQIDRFTRNILFDEKIGGTMHMALGQSYPNSGGKNQSAIHWDLICDLREGTVYADGQVCYAAGRFTV
ncbi:MAG TPA: aminopeptidase [Thermomicrobiales bacterium]|nr:aminopeptidase [Thermomicrobiales bacterium]